MRLLFKIKKENKRKRNLNNNPWIQGWFFWKKKKKIEKKTYCLNLFLKQKQNNSLLLLADSLPDISDDFSSNSKTKQSTSSSSVKALSTKKRSQLEKHELQQFKVVQNHKVFAQNPLATLKEHLSSI